jgi:predicted secreted protein
MKTLISLFSILLLSLGSPLYAADELNYNIINLQADAARQVDNDVMVVIMSALSEANNAAEAAENVNKMMAWAAAIAGKNDSIKSQTMNYQTRPLYKDKALIGWAVNQQIRFESKAFESLSTLVGTLQEKLRVQSMQFEVSSDRKDNAVTGLITVSLEAFGKKARLVTETLGARDYRIVNISVREDSPVAPYRRSFQAEAMSVQQNSAPHVEAGDSRINVRVEGTVQLIF